MPAIKKRITAEYLAEREQQRNEENGRTDADVEMEAEDAPVPGPPEQKTSSPLKRKAPSGGGSTGAHQLKWLDGEVLLEKRKRTIPPAELKLATWLDLNFEKKPEVHLSPKSLYSFYTDMCQQEGGGVVEIHQFNKMLHDKFGKEFGLKEGSIKDLIDEALKASGNPKKGMRFHWIKQYIAAKYPAFQIEHRPTVLRSALERRVAYGKVELVKGIGFCGYYLRNVCLQEAKDSGDVENGEKTDDTTTDDDKKESIDIKTEDEEKEKDAGDSEKPAKKKAKRKAKPKRKFGYKDIDHSNPQRLEDVFPLALTYMSEPKEASFSKIKKYLEKYYGKADIEERLKRTLENGCDIGMWDRLSGAGKSGSFQLQVDSFNPDHTESLTDMVCSAIIACAEPKVASYQLIKSYISEYHPDFNIDARPHKLKQAIMRAIQKNTLVQVSGLGMTGSFQLADPFTPSPAILAGNDEDYSSEEEEEGGPSNEVYVVRKTKSGRRAPVERLAYSTEKKKGRLASSSRRGAAKSGRNAGRKSTPKYADSDSEESAESEEEEEASDTEKYTPRKTKSGRGRGAQPAKSAPRGGSSKTKGNVSTPKGRGKPKKSAAQSNLGKRGRPANTKLPVKVESDDERDTYVPQPTKSGRANNKRPAKKPVTPTRGRMTNTKKSYAEDADDEENFYEIEEAAPPPAKKGKQQKVAGKENVGKTPAKTPQKQKARGNKAEAPDSLTSAGRPPRSASKSARKSMKESAASDSEEDEYVARPTASGRGAKKR
ncbi:hypothetical protein BaRGS_00007503 [Batillaria attramentaria]|uniref:H15 domain-containing protein n=1 Tax=Batillaria attramentaria TaxID=370345 RepID=A0ABD0LQU1_9CAEN